MNALFRLRQWWQTRERYDDSPWDGDTPAWLVSLLLHLGVLVALAMLMVAGPERQEQFALVSSHAFPDDPLVTSEEFNVADMSQEEIGSSSDGESNSTVSFAPTLDVIAATPTPLDVTDAPQTPERIVIQDELRMATGLQLAENLTIKGAAGVGATGATGAVDRLTQEILRSLEERRTLVVWLFDQSGSLERQRSEILKRFDRIYEELGVIEASGNPAFKKHEDKPLLSAVVAFGQNISFLTKPGDNVEELKSAVASMKTDDSGIERIFGAVIATADRYRPFRTQEPRRNVMIVLFTDEVGDDEMELDHAVTVCRRLEIPVYCVGVPAPFGRREAEIKYVDPDPKYDQTPQWVPVRQGPESFMPELVKIGAAEELIDSGFGPYSLTRLCFETGGIFFAVHPNRDERRVIGRNDTAVLSAQLSRFFNPEIMNGYRPDYVSIKEYQRLLRENKSREALVKAAEMASLTPMESPELTFPKVNDADLANRLTRAQRSAAVLEPKINQLYEVLRQGEKDRARLTTPRWQAGYDLSMGRVLALKVRTEGYNAMLAKAKQGMRFENAKNDTWRLMPANEFSAGSALEKQAEQAKGYLQRVREEHPNTPWAYLAEKELKEPLGWAWKEAYTGVNEPRERPNPNNMPRPPRDDQARKLPKPVKRPAPKL